MIGPVRWFLLVWPIGVLAGDADLILHHGKLVTVNQGFSVCEAMAVKDGRVLQVGGNDEILGLKGAQTEVLDLAGRMVLPGLIDSHVHPTAAAMTEFDHPIPTMETVADVLEYVRGRAQVLPEGKWIVVQQVFITRLKEQRYPTRLELDRVAPRHPVVFRTGPDASLNSLALQRSGIDTHFKIPEGLAGKVERDAQGEPTGILRTFANYVKLPASEGRKPTGEERLQRLIELFRDYNSAGLTSICDRDADTDALGLYEELRRRGALTVRISASEHIDTLGSMVDIQDRIRRAAAKPLASRRDDWLRVIGVKTYLDGGMLTGSAYMRQPWGVSDIYAITDPAYRGTLFIPKDRLLPIVRAAVESGMQFTAHTVGDGAVHLLLDVYEELARELPLRETRPCISHCNFMSREAVETAARLGVMLDIQPAWLYLDARTLAAHFGCDRLRYFQPLRSLFEARAVAGGGSDHMQKIGSLRSINPYNPFLGMATAVTRRAKGKLDALHPEEALSRGQAIRFYTINNARLLFLDDRAGSLEPGKLADFVVLDTDLLKCPEEKIVATRVLGTYVGGKLVWRGEPQP